jgi:predicted aspartyl protease
VLCLPWNFAVDAGLDPQHGKPQPMTMADGTTRVAAKVTATLRVGQFTARDVDCVVMPPQAGDVTPLLGQTFLSRCNFRIDADDKVLLISAAGAASEPRARKR